jgi:hypothetical protein
MAIEQQRASVRRVSQFRHQKCGVAVKRKQNGVVRVQIPYFGIVRIARQGVVSKEIAKA